MSVSRSQSGENLLNAEAADDNQMANLQERKSPVESAVVIQRAFRRHLAKQQQQQAKQLLSSMGRQLADVNALAEALHYMVAPSQETRVVSPMSAEQRVAMAHEYADMLNLGLRSILATSVGEPNQRDVVALHVLALLMAARNVAVQEQQSPVVTTTATTSRLGVLSPVARPPVDEHDKHERKNKSCVLL